MKIIQKYVGIFYSNQQHRFNQEEKPKIHKYLGGVSELAKNRRKNAYKEALLKENLILVIPFCLNN